ncbi:MAG: outer membrane lipoprotein chaperone LolA [Gammaproteobacteria bacterium]|nr:outer membrane lipoprotein chaperone LolA [Gammaproteobacteria bacterium]
MSLIVTSFCLLAALFSLNAQADTVQRLPSTELQRLLQHEDGVVARFEQQITNAQGLVIETSYGKVHLAKPNLRWEVLAPYAQIIVVRNNSVKIYDPDLDQVTVRDLGDDIEQVPLTLLTRSNLDLTDSYSVVRGGDNLDEQRFLLRPKSAEVLFERIEIVFGSNGLQALLIFDHTQQQTVIRFSDYRTDQVIQSSVFELDLPPDTDIVRG